MWDNHSKTLCLAGIFVSLSCFTLVAQEKTHTQQQANEDAARKDKEMKQVISFGIDSDLVTAIQDLERQTPRLPREDGEYVSWIEETPYNAAIYERIQKGYSSSELQTQAIRFFMRQKWLGAQEYINNIIQRSVNEGRVDNNLLLAALSYVRHLQVKSSEDGVLGLLSSENPQIVEQSILTLGKIGSTTSGVELLKMLRDEAGSFADFTNEGEREVLRVASISTLGDLAYAAAAKYLLSVLEDAKQDESRYNNAEWGAAAKALGKLGPANQKQAVALIVEQFRNGNTQQRYQAVMALSAFPLQNEFEGIILQGLQEAYWKAREEAAKTAGKLKLESAIPSLAYKVAKDSVTGVRHAAIQALRQMGGVGNSALSELMKDSDVGETQRIDILRILTKERDEIALRIFRSLLGDRNNEFRLSRTGIFRIASNAPWLELEFVYKEMLSDRDQRTQQAALYAIARERIRSLQSIVQELAENSPNTAVRRAAKSALAILNS